MTVPSRGEDAPGRSHRPSQGGRALLRVQGSRFDPVAWPDPFGPGGSICGGRRGWGAPAGQPSTCCGPRRPGGPGSPPPYALCYSFASCLWPPDRGSLPGPGSRRRPRVSRRRPRPLGSASRTPETRLPSRGRRARSPRCSALEGAAWPLARPSRRGQPFSVLGSWNQPGEGQLDTVSSLSFF